jgi:DNA-binding NtrC family response regulator/ligand-binding sensor domain-containing protein
MTSAESDTPTLARLSCPMGPGYRQGLLQSFGSSDGIPRALVYALLQDRYGSLWFGTYAGLGHYDGQRLTVFTTADGLVHDEILSLAEDRHGALWIGTARGVSRYDGKRFANLTTADGLAHDRVSSILQDHQGHLWFGAGAFGLHMPEGLSRYDGEHFTCFTTQDGLAHNQVRCLYEDRYGTLWVGTAKGVSRYQDRQDAGKCFTSFTVRDGLAHEIVNSIHQDRNGDMWFGTWAGLSRYDGREFSTITVEGNSICNHVVTIHEDRHGDLWVGTWGGVFRRVEQRFTAVFTVREGLANNQVVSILEDRNGNLWFGTLSGLTRYDARQFAYFTEEDGLTDDGVLCLQESGDGYLWAGTVGGVCYYDGERFTNLDPMRGKHVLTIIRDRQDQLWFGGMHGLSRYDGDHCVTLTANDGWSETMVLSSAEDQTGRLWFGTINGLSCYDGQKFVFFMEGTQIISLYVDGQNNLWVRTREQMGLFAAGCFSPLLSIPDLEISKAPFLERANQLLFTSENGKITRYDAESRRATTEVSELTRSDVMSIMEDRQGQLWLGTYGGGVTHYDGIVVQTLTRKDGLVHDAVQHVLQDSRGDIWIATEGGITRYRPESVPPNIRLTGVIADRRYEATDDIHLSAPQKLIAFEFQGSSFTTAPDGMAYVVQLDGHQSDWQPIYRNRVEYQDLPIGEYTFHVRAVDRDLNYSTPAAVRIIVEPDSHLAALSEALNNSNLTGDFMGESAALRQVQAQLREVAPTDATVLILGETGTGKGLAARALHKASRRADGPFIQVHCGAIPENLVESELFGHEKGAFTGAVSRKLGKAELAQGGTLFLDEIGDMRLGAQVKLLQLLEEHTFDRIGGTRPLSADVRIAAATNRNLLQMVKDRTFREDLYFRLAVFPVTLPPLRVRKEDIPLLALYFMQRMASHLHKNIEQLTWASYTKLQAYDWPGNVRELQHVIQRAVIICSTSTLRPQDLILGSSTSAIDLDGDPITLEENERRHIRAVLEKARWVVRGEEGAAKILGTHEATLRSKMKRLGIVRPSA